MSDFNPNNQTQTQILSLAPFNLLYTYDKYLHLKIYVDDNNYPGLKQKYIDNALNHNNKVLNPDKQYLDAGFDIFNPTRRDLFRMNNTIKLDFGIICSAKIITDSNKIYNTGYYMYPRSSISKTKLRLANSTGIIDSGYRGNLIGMFDFINLSNDEVVVIDEYDRLLQICAPGLVPIVVEIVNTIDELGTQTERGSGGFGSTGR